MRSHMRTTCPSSVAGKSPSIPVTMKAPKAEWFRRHSSQVVGPLNWVAASGVRGLESLTLALDRKAAHDRTFTVRLVFMEPDPLGPGQRRFHVLLQGREVLRNLDIVAEAGRPLRSLVKEFRAVRVTESLHIRLVASGDLPTVLCGVEVIEEPPAR